MKYKIKSGDTLSQIAKDNNISLKKLAELNNIKDVNKIFAGKTLDIPSREKPKTKKSSSVERVNQSDPFFIQEESGAFKSTRPKSTTPKSTTSVTPAVQEKKIIEEESFLPINIRQIFNPGQNRTEKDLSKEERDVLKKVIARSQTPERIAEKEESGLNPYAIEYKDYESTKEGAQYADVGGDMGLLGLLNKLQNPAYNLKTFLGQASAIPQEGGGYRIQDVYDFKPKTRRQGLGKFEDYLSSVGEAGFNPYSQVRNFMGYYGPQEGTGEGGRSDIRIMQQGGDTMDIQQQTKNVAAQGRYGDSMLLHVNPAEVKGLASAMPITVNPQTGQPEAFLPFLAPIFGSMLGGSLLAGSTLGGLATAGLSKAAAAGIGAGLAQTAVTGDIKEGLKAGLTAGMGARIFGGGAEASKFAEGAQGATDAATKINTNVLLQDPTLAQAGQASSTLVGPVPPVLNQAGQMQLSNMMPDASEFIAQGGKDAVATYSGNIAGPGAATFGEDFTTMFGKGDNFNLGQGLSNIGSAAMNDPLALATLGTTGTMYGMDMMQADYEEQMARMQAEREEKKRQNELMNPEPILYSAEGGRTGYFMGGDMRAAIDSVGGQNITGGELPQIFAPARQAYDVNPNFMAGFNPETMYFNPSTISAPASGLEAGGPPIVLDTYTGTKGGYGGDPLVISPEGRQASIDPFSAYTGEAPAGLVPYSTTQPAPYIDITGEDLGITDGTEGVYDPTVDGITKEEPIIDESFDPNNYTIPDNIQDLIDSLDLSNINFMGSNIDLTGFNPLDYTVDPKFEVNDPTNMDDLINLDNNLMTDSLDTNINNNLNDTFDIDALSNLDNINAGIDSFTTTDNTLNNTLDLSAFDPYNQLDTTTNLGVTDTLSANTLAGFNPLNTFGLTEDQLNRSKMDSLTMAEGGQLPNKGLETLNKVAPDVVDKMGYQEGGMTMMNDPLTQEVTAFLLGESNNEEALNMFLTKYGNEAFMQLREAVLQSVVPGAQTQGQIKGNGEGGMDDDLRGMIGDKERIAVSQDEFIVPADVVSMLGDGSSDAGSKELYDMMDRVRQEKTGTTKQAPRLANAGGMLPA